MHSCLNTINLDLFFRPSSPSVETDFLLGHWSSVASTYLAVHSSSVTGSSAHAAAASSLQIRRQADKRRPRNLVRLQLVFRVIVHLWIVRIWSRLRIHCTTKWKTWLLSQKNLDEIWSRKSKEFVRTRLRATEDISEISKRCWIGRSGIYVTTLTLRKSLSTRSFSERVQLWRVIEIRGIDQIQKCFQLNSIPCITCVL